MKTDPDFKTLNDLLTYFNDQKNCMDFLEKMRWPVAVTCPICNSTKISRRKKDFHCLNPACGKVFHAATGTIYARSRIGLSTWFAVIFLACHYKLGINSMDLQRLLKI